MKRGLAIICVCFILILSLSVVSAGFFSELWNKITGKAVDGCDDSDGYLGLEGSYYVKGIACAANGCFTDSCVEEGGFVLREFSCSLEERVVYLRYTCPGGGICSEGVCGDICVADTCVSLGYECGTHDDGCGGSLDCDVCSSGKICSNGNCIEEGQGCVTFYLDSDGDDYGTTDNQCLESASEDYTASQSGDCDDSDSGINPLVEEVCEDGEDNNCDGNIDEGCVVEGEEEIPSGEVEGEEVVEGAEEIIEDEIEEVLGEEVVLEIVGDLDADGILDIHDPDVRGDGILDSSYQGVSANGDEDGDGILNIDDEDIDGDGILNGFDVAFGTIGTIEITASVESVGVSEEPEELDKEFFQEGIVRSEESFVQQTASFSGYIVELEEEPLAVENVKLEEKAEKNEGNFLAQAVGPFGLATTKSNIKRKLENKREDLESDRETVKERIKDELEKTSVITGNAVGDSEEDLVVLTEYEIVFNGFALDITPEEAEEIKEVRGVKSVTPNYLVDLTLMDSVPLINADDVWQLDEDRNDCSTSGKECLTGKGITIGIIDTGVDYTHGDLGGCFGEGCKVVGGWDFSDNDDDPMDDHGHGTHVAATAAGNGILKGVAPDAEIYAYKVFPNSYRSVIVAAIERSMDPDQNGDFSDHLDVISLSLGGGGNPDDFMSTAIDIAVGAGVVAVISAGNDGPDENTIGSPGTARKAITVGASYKKDYGRFVHSTCVTEDAKKDGMACFSSRGPVTWTDMSGEIKALVKPDITAPGVDICAAQSSQDKIWQEVMNSGQDIHCLDNQHIAISGTSMAAPHVSGAVALLLQKNPDWTPGEVKMALRNTAVDIGEDVNTQGYGRMDILSAVGLESAPAIAEIETGGEVSGVIDIIGTASGRDFGRYVLYYGVGEDPSEWVEIVSSTSQIEEGILYSGFETKKMENYLLKLEVYDVSGKFSVDISPLKYETYSITYPKEDDYLKENSRIEIIGTAAGENFDYYRIFLIGEHEGVWRSVPEAISLVNEGNEVISNDILGVIDVSQIESGHYSLRLLVFDTEGNYEYLSNLAFIIEKNALSLGWPQSFVHCSADACYNLLDHPTVADIDSDGDSEIIGTMDGKVFVYNHDGTLASGWPKELLYGGNTQNSPAVGDINNDGHMEIVVGSSMPGYLYVYSHDGTLASGWPINLGGYLGPITLEDINNDGGLEIIVGHSYGTGEKVYVLDEEGNILPGWPSETSKDIYWSFSVGDVDNDGQKEIIVARQNGIYILDINGNAQLIKSFSSDSQTILKAALGDLDNDGDLEIVFSSKEGYVHVLNHDGSYFPGWPKKLIRKVPTPSGIDKEIELETESSPALADIDGDGDIEIILGSTASTSAFVFAFHHDGELVENWPIKIYIGYYARNILTSPSIGDIDGDGLQEIIISNGAYGYSNHIYAFNHDGSRVDGWTIPVPGSMASFNSPSIADLDNDGFIDIIFVNNHRDVYVIKTNSIYDSKNMEWPMSMHDPQHTGLYGYDPDACVPSEEICDDKDNDCDEEVDEDFLDKGTSCSVGVSECASDGILICKADGSGTECDAVEGIPTTEICDDGIDNDCDELVDYEDIGDCSRCDRTDSSCFYDDVKEICVDCSVMPTSQRCGGVFGRTKVLEDYYGCSGDGCVEKTRVIETCKNFCSNGACSCHASGTQVNIFTRNNCCNGYETRTETDYGRCRWRIVRGEGCARRRNGSFKKWYGTRKKTYCK